MTQDAAPDLLIEDEMKESYLTYAMSVLVDRALPDLRDGLKPVHRRILQTLRDLNLTPGAKYRKSAKIVGDCLGNYHPHGDSSVYDAMVRMAQDFSLRYEMVDGQGNFGSIDGDGPAAYRYTEARMTRYALEMLDDIQYDTVEHRPTFDGTREEPTVLPARLPNLLVNGSSGIAVGMATNIPSHNLGEVCAAITHLIDHPDCTVVDLMQHIHAPDFATGAKICGLAGVRAAYQTGRGRIVMRAKVGHEIIDHRDCLVVTEIPYGIKLQTITDSIKAADADGRITGLAKMNGGAVGDSIRLVIELKRGEDPDLVLNQLWEHTNLQYNFAVNMVALDRGRPRQVTLKRMCEAYVEHRTDVIVRRTRFLLARDEARLHIQEGLLKAIDLIDAIIALIRAAPDQDGARAGLIARFGFSERQAQAILDMQLRRLTGLERDKLLAEIAALTAAVADYRAILATPARQLAIIKADLADLVKTAGTDPRRTEIVADAGDFNMEDLIEDAPCVVTITNSGYIKRLPIDTFRLQRRGGKGVSGGALKDDDDFIARMFSATNHQYLLVFTTLGKVYWLKVYDVPEGSRTARGKHLANVLSLSPDEKISETIPVRAFAEDQFLLMATSQGQIKKTELSAYGNPRVGGIKGIKLADGDHLVDVVITHGKDEILIASDDGQACRFEEEDCRATGRDTSGVAGIDLAPNAAVVSLIRLEPGSEVLTICRNGFGKRTPYEDYRLTRRGGKGVINIDTSARNGPVVASLGVTPGDELVLMTRKGQAIRVRVDDIRTTGRAAQGVKLFDLDDGDQVTGVARCPRDSDLPGIPPPTDRVSNPDAPEPPQPPTA